MCVVLKGVLVVYQYLISYNCSSLAQNILNTEFVFCISAWDLLELGDKLLCSDVDTEYFYFKGLSFVFVIAV